MLGGKKTQASGGIVPNNYFVEGGKFHYIWPLHGYTLFTFYFHSSIQYICLNINWKKMFPFFLFWFVYTIHPILTNTFVILELEVGKGNYDIMHQLYLPFLTFLTGPLFG